MSKSELMVRDDRFESVETRLAKMRERADEFCQSRSSFQIEKFIACDEHTPITKFRLVAHNSHVALQEAKRLMIERERKLRKRELLVQRVKLQGHGDSRFENCDLDICELDRQIEDDELRIKGLLKEVEVMESICDQLERTNGGKFTYDQFKKEEPEYWSRRLASQMHRDQMGMKFGIGPGNYASYLQAIEDPILPDSGNQARPFNFSDPNAVATMALSHRGAVGKLLLKEKSEDSHGSGKQHVVGGQVCQDGASDGERHGDGCADDRRTRSRGPR